MAGGRSGVLWAMDGEARAGAIGEGGEEGGEERVGGGVGKEGGDLQEALVQRLLDDPGALERKGGRRGSEGSSMVKSQREKGLLTMSGGGDAEAEAEEEDWGSSSGAEDEHTPRAETAPGQLILEELLTEAERTLIEFFAFEDHTRPGTVGVPGEGEGRGWRREKVGVRRSLTAVVSPRRCVGQHESGPMVRREGLAPIGGGVESKSWQLGDDEALEYSEEEATSSVGEEDEQLSEDAGAGLVERTASGTSIRIDDYSRAHVGAHARIGRLLAFSPHANMPVQGEGVGVGGGGRQAA